MIPKHQQINVWMNMSETPEKKKARLCYDNVLKTAWTDMSFISLNIPEREINLHFVNLQDWFFNQSPFCVLLKNIPFFHGFIILYLKFWLHRFYIQNAAECTILRPSEKKISGGGITPLPLLVSRGLACMHVVI
jgi:hypothetical protein